MSEIKEKTFSSFESIQEVCRIFDYDYEMKPFIEEKFFKINEYLESSLREEFNDDKNMVNEFVICEALLRPILSAVARENKIPLWSHIKFEYDKSVGLSGEADYFLAPKEKGTFSTPILCVAEAKKENFTKGWAQVAAEMIASQKKNKDSETIIYGLVSTGEIWKFAKLKGSFFTIDPNSHAAPAEFQKIFNILNWMFCEARKNADILIEKNK